MDPDRGAGLDRAHALAVQWLDSLAERPHALASDW
jgi:hypothetical protein